MNKQEERYAKSWMRNHEQEHSNSIVLAEEAAKELGLDTKPGGIPQELYDWAEEIKSF